MDNDKYDETTAIKYTKLLIKANNEEITDSEIDELLKEGLWSIYDGDKLLTVFMEAVEENQAGEYKCIIENECDKTEIIYNLTVTKWDETNGVEVISENGYALYNCLPNPVTGLTKIRFEMSETNNAQITRKSSRNG